MKDLMVKRHLKQELDLALQTARVVNVVGPRQGGKTTLVRELYGRGRFITLDDPAVLSAIEEDALGQLAILTRDLTDAPLVIDEAQRSQNLALAIKQIVDGDRRMGQFLLTGSSNVFTAKHVVDSLAGRIRTLKLWPLTMAEVSGVQASGILDWAVSENRNLEALRKAPELVRSDYLDMLCAGGYPEIRVLPLRARQQRYRDYVEAVVNRDVEFVAPIRKGTAMRRLINQLAVRTGQEINVAELSKVIGLQRQTLEVYLDILEALSMFVRLPAWTSGEARREIRNAKLHFVDNGVACALRGLVPDSFGTTSQASSLGGLLESFVFSELFRSAPFQQNHFRFYHWRGPRREVDLLAETASGLVAVEVKASMMVTSRDLRHLRWFASDGPGRSRRVTSIIFYMGKEALTFGGGVFALPVSSLWSG